jgi:hypothetical protein
MTARHSALVPARQALLGRLRALRLRDVDIQYSWSENIGNRAIYTGDARGEHSVAALRAGRKTRNERLTFDVIIDVTTPGDDQVQADLAAAELAGAVEDLVADDPSLGAAEHGVQAVTVAEYESTAFLAEHGRGCRIRLGLSLTARLT